MCKHLWLFLGRFFTRVIAFLEELHKGQGQHQGSCEAHYGNRKEDNGLKIPEILKEGGRQIRQEIGVYFRAVESKENRKQNRCDESNRYPGHEAFSIRKLPAQFQFVKLYGFIDAKSRNNPVEKTVKNVGVEVKKGKDQKVGDQAATGGNAKPHGECKSHHSHRKISFQ